MSPRSQSVGGNGPLLPRPLRAVTPILIVCALTVIVGLAWRVADRSGGTRIDRYVDGRVSSHLAGVRHVLAAVVDVANPVIMLILAVGLGLTCWALRERKAALLAFVGPLAALVLTEFALKPLVDRHPGDAFPSGHTTAAVSVAAVLVLFLLPGGVLRRHLPRGTLGLAWVFVIAMPLTLGTALVALDYHYSTDVAGGASVAIAVVLLSAAVIDRTVSRRAR